MAIVIEFLLFIVGLAALLWGADKLVEKARILAIKFKVHPIIIGVTVLSIGTSLPEIATSIFSFTGGHANVAIGNIVGSELVQITLILGIVALINPLKGSRKQIVFYGISMLVAVLLALSVVWDGVIMFFEGVMLITAYILFLIYIVERDKNLIRTEHGEPKKQYKTHHLTIMIILGLALTIIGSKLMINSAVEISRYFNVSEYFISVFLIGLGTSLPELVVSGIAAYKRHYGVSIGNLLGSNITDPTLSFGLGAIFSNKVIITSAAPISIMYLFFVCFVVLGFFVWKKKVSRPIAFVALFLYIASFWII